MHYIQVVGNQYVSPIWKIPKYASLRPITTFFPIAEDFSDQQPLAKTVHVLIFDLQQAYMEMENIPPYF